MSFFFLLNGSFDQEENQIWVKNFLTSKFVSCSISGASINGRTGLNEL